MGPHRPKKKSAIGNGVEKRRFWPDSYKEARLMNRGNLKIAA
jgi:hypothetical protein